MRSRTFLSMAVAIAALALSAHSAPAGEQLPPVEVEEFAQTKAKSFDDLSGRTVLIEFFAYW